MPLRSRVLPEPCLVAILIVCLTALATGWLAPRVQDYEDLPALARRLGEIQQTEEELQELLENVRQRAAVKEQALVELAAGRLTLPETVARFRAADQTWPGGRVVGDSLEEEESLYRVIIQRACDKVASEAPERRAAVIARLEAELQAQLSR
jgi:chorismate mutase